MKKLLIALAAVTLLATPASAEYGTKDTTELLTLMALCDSTPVLPGSGIFKVCLKTQAELRNKFNTYSSYKAARKDHEEKLIELLNVLPLDGFTRSQVNDIIFSRRQAI